MVAGQGRDAEGMVARPQVDVKGIYRDRDLLRPAPQDNLDNRREVRNRPQKSSSADYLRSCDSYSQVCAAVVYHY